MATAEMVKIFAALGNETRYTIIQGLKTRAIGTCCDRIELYENGVSVGDVVNMTGLAQSTISQHLKVLEEADLIRRERRGQWTCFFLNQETIREFLAGTVRDFYA